MVVYTIGHSTRSLEEFTALLRAAAVTLVVDVRAFPMSRRWTVVHILAAGQQQRAAMTEGDSRSRRRHD